ncbi:MAG: cell division protein FtsH, partial [Desulfosporosinus sp.]
MKFFKNTAIYILIILMAIVFIKWSTPPVSKEVGMDYNAFKRAVVEDQVKDVAAVIEDNTIKYTVTMKDDTKHEVIGLGTDPQLTA